MVKKIKRYLKFVVCCVLIMGLVAPSYAALSASDGSAFVTKAEFDSALADFNSRLTTFEAGINSKIDSQVTSYLDRNGIWNGKEQEQESYAYVWDMVQEFFGGFDFANKVYIPSFTLEEPKFPDSIWSTKTDKNNPLYPKWSGIGVGGYFTNEKVVNKVVWKRPVLQADKSGLLFAVLTIGSVATTNNANNMNEFAVKQFLNDSNNGTTAPPKPLAEYSDTTANVAWAGIHILDRTWDELAFSGQRFWLSLSIGSNQNVENSTTVESSLLYSHHLGGVRWNTVDPIGYMTGILQPTKIIMNFFVDKGQPIDVGIGILDTGRTNGCSMFTTGNTAANTWWYYVCECTKLTVY